MPFAVPLLALAMSMLIQPSLAELPVPLAYHYILEILLAIIVVLVAVLCCLVCAQRTDSAAPPPCKGMTGVSNVEPSQASAKCEIPEVVAFGNTVYVTPHGVRWHKRSTCQHVRAASKFSVLLPCQTCCKDKEV